MFYFLNKSGIILDGIQSCFQTLEGSVACYHSAPLIFQRSGIGSAACFCKGSLCSAALRLKLQICSGGCGPTGMHPQTHNPCHSRSRSFSLSYAFFSDLNSLGSLTDMDIPALWGDGDSLEALPSLQQNLHFKIWCLCPVVSVRLSNTSTTKQRACIICYKKFTAEENCIYCI